MRNLLIALITLWLASGAGVFWIFRREILSRD